ncbi:MAG: hypothetical protein JW934_04375 [Anaerolineae bacterium]|nr:hypothetical protein [Anaerolineae bacterium]
MEMLRQSFPVELFTNARQFVGTFEPMGALLDDINDPNKGDLYLTQVTFTPLALASQFGPITVPEAIVRKHDVIFFYFKDKSAHQKFRLLARIEKMVVYTSTLAIKGDFHLGAEQRPRDMFDTMRGDFQAMTDVTIFPLHKTQAAIPREVDMILVNRQNILFYHPAGQD